MLHENKELKTPKLLHLDLETSSICNFNCNFCPRPKENGQMELSDIKRIIKEFADQGGETIKPFWRGEPMLDERMPEILKYAKECGLKTMLNTNGSFPHQNLLEIAKYTDWISFSIDKQHDNYKNLHNIPVFSTIAQRDIYCEIQACEHEQDIAVYCEIWKIPYKVDLPTKRSDTDNESEVITGERKYCGFPDWRMIIDWQGNCTMCCVDWGMENKSGNINNNPLKEIFNSNVAKNLRFCLKREIYNSNICKKCPSRSAYVN